MKCRPKPGPLQALAAANVEGGTDACRIRIAAFTPEQHGLHRSEVAVEEARLAVWVPQAARMVQSRAR